MCKYDDLSDAIAAQTAEVRAATVEMKALRVEARAMLARLERRGPERTGKSLGDAIDKATASGLADMSREQIRDTERRRS